MTASDAEVRKITIEAIQRVVADSFVFPVEQLKRKSPRGALTVPRQIAMYLAKQLTDSSLPEIGRYFGGMHHTTVMHAIAKMEHQRRTDPATNLVIGKFLNTIKTDYS